MQQFHNLPQITPYKISPDTLEPFGNMRNVIRKDGMSEVGILLIGNFADYGLKGLRVTELIKSR